MTARDGGRSSSNRLGRLGLEASLAVLAAVGLFFTLSTPFGPTPPWWASVALGVLAGVVGMAGGAIAKSIVGPKQTKMKIALGGAPGAGKTVFVIVMLLKLAETLGGDRWAADPETERALSQGERLLNRAFMPAPTREGEILRFSGNLDLPLSPIRRLIGSRSIELTVVDSAGELWERLGTEARETLGDDSSNAWLERMKSAPLIETNYFSQIADADVVFYLIGADAILERPEEVQLSVLDAISAMRMINATQRGSSANGTPLRFCLVVSKGDLLTNEHLAAIQSSLASDPESGLGGILPDLLDIGPRAAFMESLSHLEQLCLVGNRMARDFSAFVVSSVEAAVTLHTVSPGQLQSLGLPPIAISELREVYLGRRSPRLDVLAPLRWGIERRVLLKRRVV